MASSGDDIEDVPLERAIGRDPTFVRFSADRALSYHRGRDSEIIFLVDNEVIGLVDEDDIEKFATGETTTDEVARVRIYSGAALVLALDILRELAPTGNLKVSALKEAFDEILGTAEEAADKKSKAAA